MPPKRKPEQDADDSGRPAKVARRRQATDFARQIAALEPAWYQKFLAGDRCAEKKDQKSLVKYLTEHGLLALYDALRGKKAKSDLSGDELRAFEELVRAPEQKTGEANPQYLTNYLEKYGFVSIPLPETMPRDAQLQSGFDDMIKSLPEYKADLPKSYKYFTDRDEAEKNRPKTAQMQYVGGGFGALGTASSQHNEWVRSMNEWAFASVHPVLTQVAAAHPDAKELKASALFDRVLFRKPEQKVGAESLHRDTSPQAAEADLVFGGWISLGADQYLSAAPRSHTGFSCSGAGFSKMKAGSRDFVKWSNRLQLIKIPREHILIFYSSLAHEVLQNKGGFEVRRLFVGYRLSKSDAPLVEDLEERLNEQAIIPLKSNQTPAMMPKLWTVNFIKRAQAWSRAAFKVFLRFSSKKHQALARFVLVFAKPEMLEMVKRKSGKFEGQEFELVKEEMPSLQEQGAKYREYSWRERGIYFPKRKHEVLVPGSAVETMTLSL